MAYVVGVLQPHTKYAELPPDKTTQMTLEEKCQFVDELSAGKCGDLYAVVDHAGGEKTMANAKHWSESNSTFRESPEQRIGRAHEAFVDPEGHLHGILHLWHDRQPTQGIADDLVNQNLWGFSLCTDVKRFSEDGKEWVEDKRISHVGVTRTPEYGEEGSWVRHVGFSADALDRTLLKYAEQPGYYFSKQTRERLAKLKDRGAAAPTGTPLSVGATKVPDPEESGSKAAAATGSPSPTLRSTIPLIFFIFPGVLPSMDKVTEAYANKILEGSMPVIQSQPPTPEQQAQQAQQAAQQAQLQAQQAQHVEAERQRDIQSRITQLAAEADKLVGKFNYNDVNALLNGNTLNEVSRIHQELVTAIKESGFKSQLEWPMGVASTIADIDRYNKNLGERMEHFQRANPVAGANNQNEWIAVAKNPLANGPVAVQVMARAQDAEQKVHNQRKHDEELAAAHKREEEQKAKNAEYERKFEELQRQMKRQREETEEAMSQSFKRSRFDTQSLLPPASPAAPIQNLGQTGGGGGGVALSVGATKTMSIKEMRPDQYNKDFAPERYTRMGEILGSIHNANSSRSGILFDFIERVHRSQEHSPYTTSSMAVIGDVGEFGLKLH
jgi:hypothetical protein